MLVLVAGDAGRIGPGEPCPGDVLRSRPADVTVSTRQRRVGARSGKRVHEARGRGGRGRGGGSGSGGCSSSGILVYRRPGTRGRGSARSRGARGGCLPSATTRDDDRDQEDQEHDQSGRPPSPDPLLALSHADPLPFSGDVLLVLGAHLPPPDTPSRGLRSKCVAARIGEATKSDGVSFVPRRFRLLSVLHWASWLFHAGAHD